jgi:hypothetical protein
MATDVSECIRARIASGLLPTPTDPSGKLWVGKGDRHACSGCDQAIMQAQTE